MFIQASPAETAQVKVAQNESFGNECNLFAECLKLMGFHPTKVGLSKEYDLFIILDDNLDKELVNRICQELQFLRKCYIIDNAGKVWVLEQAPVPSKTASLK